MSFLDRLGSLLGGGSEEDRSLRVQERDPLGDIPVVTVNHRDLYLAERFDYGSEILMWPAALSDRVMRMFLKDDRVSKLYVANGGSSNYFQSQIYEEYSDTFNLKTKDYISRQIPELVKKGKIRNIDTIYARDFAMTYRFSDRRTKINNQDDIDREALEKCDKNFREITEAEARASHETGAELVYLDLHDLKYNGERNEKLRQQVLRKYDHEVVQKEKFMQSHWKLIAEIFAEYFESVHVMECSGEGHLRKDAVIAQNPR